MTSVSAASRTDTAGWKKSRSAAALGLVFALGLEAQSRQVTPGLDALREEGAGAHLSGRRIGLITNHTGRSLEGKSTLRVFREELGLTVVALFSPEHGLSGEVAAGDEVQDSRESESGLPIYSLYGETRAPTREMLLGIETLVFDIQDVGVRFFTYPSTLKLAMRAAAEAGIDFVVLDRPNPNGGLRIEGPVLEPRLESFVGAASIPLLHGMTVGELARLFQASDPDLGQLSLRVVEMRGWKRDMLWDDTGLPWRSPSPNLRTPHSAIAYAAFGLLEGVDISEGRGTPDAFEKFGAPWIDGVSLADALSRRQLPGISFRAATFVPESVPEAPRPRYGGERCQGVSIEIGDPRAFEPVRTGLTAIAILRSLYPESFRWVKRGEGYWIDLLLGTDLPRLHLDSGVEVEKILSSERPAIERFLQERKAYLLY